MSMLPTNAIVARITGMNKKLLGDAKDGPSGPAQEESIGGFSSPSPLDAIRAQKREQPHERRQREHEESFSRGDRADFQYDKAMDSQKKKAPKHKMPNTDADEMDGADMDDEQYQVGSKQTEAKRSMSKKFYNECIGSMESFRFYAGLPQLTEMTVAEPRAAHSGDVPTAGVNKSNKMKAGLPGLDGEALQKIEPEGGPGDDDEVGDSKEMTLDAALAMLKKEGVDTDELWVEFLEQRGLTADLFDQLVDEAIEGENVEEMDSLLAVESYFLQALPKLIPEGLMDMFRKKKEAQPDPLAAVKKGGEMIRQHGAAAVRAANARGVVPTAAPARKDNGYVQNFSSGTRSSRSRSQTRQMPIAKAEGWEMECDHDGNSGGPRMPWESKMTGLAGKYLSESKKPAKKSKKAK